MTPLAIASLPLPSGPWPAAEAGRYTWNPRTGAVLDTWTGLSCTRSWASRTGLPRVRIGDARVLLGALLRPLLPRRYATCVVSLAPADAAALRLAERCGGLADITAELLQVRAPGRPGRRPVCSFAEALGLESVAADDCEQATLSESERL